MLGEYLEENCPSVSVRSVIKHPEEWGDYCEKIMRDYGFTQKSAPMIFAIEGELIGAGDEFVEHVRERYNKVLGMTKENQKGRLEHNKRTI